MSNQFKNSMAFEDDVRRVAEAIWGLTPGDCQPKSYPNNKSVSEIDGVAETRDVVHLLMVTTSTKLEKAKSDVNKLNAAAAIEEKRGKPVAKWLITQEHLNAEHIGYAKKK